MTRWTIKRFPFGWGLFHDGELVAGSDEPLPLLLLPAAARLTATRPS